MPINNSVYGWLIDCPVSDCNYKMALDKATIEELEMALEHFANYPKNNKSRYILCRRRLSKLKKPTSANVSSSQ